MGWDIAVKEKVYQRLANEIFFRIYNGTYPLGSKLPSYLDIAKEAGSSPETVRKAVKELQSNGVVNKTHWGLYVTSERKTVQEYCDRYIIVIEKEYATAKEKVGK